MNRMKSSVYLLYLWYEWLTGCLVRRKHARYPIQYPWRDTSRWCHPQRRRSDHPHRQKSLLRLSAHRQAHAYGARLPSWNPGLFIIWIHDTYVRNPNDEDRFREEIISNHNLYPLLVRILNLHNRDKISIWINVIKVCFRYIPLEPFKYHL